MAVHVQSEQAVQPLLVSKWCPPVSKPPPRDADLPQGRADGAVIPAGRHDIKALLPIACRVVFCKVQSCTTTSTGSRQVRGALCIPQYTVRCVPLAVQFPKPELQHLLEQSCTLQGFPAPYGVSCVLTPLAGRAVSWGSPG